MAGGAAAIEAGQAYVSLTLRDGQLIAGLDKVKAKLMAFGSSITAMGEKLAVGAFKAGLPFGLSAKVFADFEYAMARTKAVVKGLEVTSGPEELAEKFEALDEEARRLGRDTMFMAVDAARAMAILATQGF